MGPHPVARAWAQRVVAWHNRHPLARRIGAADLAAPGHVELPFSADSKRRLFSERFLPRLSLRRIARLARRDGSVVAPDDALPRRLVAVDPKRVREQQAVQPRWLATVAIGSGRGATRVLLGSSAVLGRRQWSRPRLAVVTSALLLAAWLPRLPELAGVLLPPTAEVQVLAEQTSGDADTLPAAAAGDGGHAAPAGHADATPVVGADPVVAGADDAASAAHDADAAAAGRDDAAAASAASAAATQATVTPGAVATTDAAVAATSASAMPPPAPPAAEPFPPQRPQFDPATKTAAREAVARARAARAVASGGTVFALATPRVRTQAESELLADALRSAAAGTDAPPGWHVEVMPAGDDWRAVGWPFTRAADAERLRDRIAARGLRIELIAF